MGTVALPSASAELRERLFFLIMAIAIAVTVIVAFSLFYVAGISSFGSPWWVHVHGVTFMGWIGFYVLQNTLVFKNDIALHRKLGWIGVVFAVWMVLVGSCSRPSPWPWAARRRSSRRRIFPRSTGSTSPSSAVWSTPPSVTAGGPTGTAGSCCAPRSASSRPPGAG
jgi:hypothetical protein